MTTEPEQPVEPAADGGNYTRTLKTDIDPDNQPTTESPLLERKYQVTKRWLILIIITLAVGHLTFRFLVQNEIQQTAALFVGLPALLAIAIVLTPRPTSATGAATKSVTLALLLSGVALGEGFLCILISSPLFYLVALMVGLAEDAARKRKMNRNKVRAVVWLPLFVMSFEGVSDNLSFPRLEEIKVSKIVEATVAECEEQLSRTPAFPKPLPAFLAAGWPRPAETTGTGLALNDIRQVRFVGSEGSPGVLTMKVTEREPGRVRFTAVEDTSHMPHWLDWHNSLVELAEASDGQTRVTWTTTYVRRLDPAWYFRPWQRHAVHLATHYLIDNLATPST